MRLKVTYHRNGTVSYEIDGRPATEEEVAEAFPPKPIGCPLQAQTPTCWPMESDALAVHPKQIAEAMERDRRHGIKGVSYRPEDGTCILADRGARRDKMRLQGVHDNQGGYGDDHA